MKPRLQLFAFEDTPALIQKVSEILSELTEVPWQVDSQQHVTLYECCEHAFRLGARSIVIQRRVFDPDFLAEFNAYYSRLFAHSSRDCARLHFFKQKPVALSDPLRFLDTEALPVGYCGFITLRPVGRTPVAATFLVPGEGGGNIRCLDEFPVHLGGIKLRVVGTPFMQQDNAVGACAQASIWMALRTMRKREGDRAFDPAQISGEATRFSTVTRILPNREGLTDGQMLHAVRGTGYSPHLIWLSTAPSDEDKKREELRLAKHKISIYLDSEIPVLLALYSTSGHAVVAIGYTFTNTPTNAVTNVNDSRSITGVAVPIAYTTSWIQELIIHNDNSGPYLRLPDCTNPAKRGYALEQADIAIPLLPTDVFLTGEEAMQVGLGAWDEVLIDLTATLANHDKIAFAERFALRLLLLDRRHARSWGRDNAPATDLASEMRLADLPRRVWALEIHLKDEVGKHATEAARSMIGFILIDPTGDVHPNSVLVTYLNLPMVTDEQHGAMVVARPAKSFQIPPLGLLPPFRAIHGHAAPFGA